MRRPSASRVGGCLPSLERGHWPPGFSAGPRAGCWARALPCRSGPVAVRASVPPGRPAGFDNEPAAFWAPAHGSSVFGQRSFLGVMGQPTALALSPFSLPPALAAEGTEGRGGPGVISADPGPRPGADGISSTPAGAHQAGRPPYQRFYADAGAVRGCSPLIPTGSRLP